MNTTRAKMNFMSNHGTGEKNSVSLKDEYFKAGGGSGEKGSKFFRVKKEVKK